MTLSSETRHRFNSFFQPAAFFLPSKHGLKRLACYIKFVKWPFIKICQGQRNAFNLGEVVNFEIEMFEDSGDANPEIIIKLIKQMEAAKQSLMNLNIIDQDEIDGVAKED